MKNDQNISDNYEYRLFIYLDNMKPGRTINIQKLKYPDRFIAAVKGYMDTGTFNDFTFSNDYKYIIKKTLPFGR